VLPRVVPLTADELTQHVTALADNKLARDRALADESARHWDVIWNERCVTFPARSCNI